MILKNFKNLLISNKLLKIQVISHPNENSKKKFIYFMHGKVNLINFINYYYANNFQKVTFENKRILKFKTIKKNNVIKKIKFYKSF